MLNYIKSLTSKLMWKSKTPKEEEVITPAPKEEEVIKEEEKLVQMSDKEVLAVIAENIMESNNAFKIQISNKLKECIRKM